MAIYQPNVDWFAEQLGSIARQSLQNWQCFIRADSELANLRQQPQLQLFFADSRFHWQQNPNRLGHKGNFEAALRDAHAAQPRWIFCCDQDDIWLPDKMQTQIAILEQAPSHSLVHCDLLMYDGQTTGSSVWALESRHALRFSSHPIAPLMLQNMVTGTSCAFDAKLLDKVPAISDACDFHDHWLAILAAIQGGIYPINKPLVLYRQHNANVIGAQQLRLHGRLNPPSAAEKWLQSVALWQATSKLVSQQGTGGFEIGGFKRHPALRLGLLWAKIIFESHVLASIGLLLAAITQMIYNPRMAKEYGLRFIGKVYLSFGRGSKP